ncbi:MAG: hypothetical protein K2O18_15220 [Oscillospiraceae bacterium]|nr:hypothetical protein [Oscillospiraceae bacterium]
MSNLELIFTASVIEYLTQTLAHTITCHGVLLDIAGEGVIITGDSSVGKSEAVIELVICGHRLVTDDTVEICRVVGQLLGKAPDLTRNDIELRGICIIDVHQLMGMRAVNKEA